MPNSLGSELNLIPDWIKVAYGFVELQQSERTSKILLGEDWFSAKDKFRAGKMIPNPGTFYRRSFFKTHGYFDESFRIAGDYEMLLRELPENDARFLPDLTVSGMHPGGVSSSPETTILMWREVRRAQIMHGLRFPSRYWILAISRARARSAMRTIWGEEKSRVLIAAWRSAITRILP